MELAPDGRQIRAFREKPEFPLGVPGDPDQAMVSMGNYVFDAKVLVEAVTADSKDASSGHDVGGDIIPMLVDRGEAQVFDFANHVVPGVSEREHGYWRDIGTLDAYYAAHMDLISPDPIFNLYNRDWPILKQPDRLPPAKFVFDEPGRTGLAVDSMVCAGVIVSGGVVRRSVLSPGVYVRLGRRRRGLGAPRRRRDRRRRGREAGDRGQERGDRAGAHRSASTSSATASGSSSRPAGSSSWARASAFVTDIRVALLTREYPPDVYGGAGVHVEYLARELARLVDVTVHCWGAPRPADWRPPVVAYEPWDALAGSAPHLAALRAVSIDLAMSASAEGASLVHSHTWYANFGGHLAKLIHGIPHVATVHSLEPLRPWKAEQLGGGYALSSFCERTGLENADAIIGVSGAMRDDILRTYPAIDPGRVGVVHNGIDTERVPPRPGDRVPRRLRDRPGRAVGRVRGSRDQAERPHAPAPCGDDARP